MKKKYCYIKLSEEELKCLETAIEQLGFANRTEYVTACAHVLIYGRNPYEWNISLNCLKEKKELQKKTFLDTVHEKAFSIIAMNGTGAILKGEILEDIKNELMERCRMIPEDFELREWLTIYKNLHRDELAKYRGKIITERFGGSYDS